MRDDSLDVERAVTSKEDTLWGDGLWRGMFVHPRDGCEVDGEKWSIGDIRRAIKKGAEPIQDFKGLGIRLTPVHASDRIEHFREVDGTFKTVVANVFPQYHDACVRVLAAHLRSEGFDALRRLCMSDVLPSDTWFEFGSVLTEKTLFVNGSSYRPDIVIYPASPDRPRIELELVNTHGPTDERLELAAYDGALVIWMNIRDLVRDMIMDRRRELLPDDGVLLSRLQRLRFTSVSHRSRLRAKVNRIWLDADQAEYMTKLTEDVDAARLRFMPVLRDVQKCASDLKGLAPEVLDVRAFSGRMQALVPEPLVAFGADGTESFPRFMRNLIGESGISYASGEIRMPVEMHTARKAIESYRHVTAMATPVREALNGLMAAMERVVSDCSEILKIGREVWDCILPSWLRRREKMILAARGRRAEAEALRSKQDEEEKLLRAAEAAERERAVSERAATAAAAAAASRARAEQLTAAAREAEQREAAARAYRIERWRTDASAMVDEALQSARDSEQSNDLLGALSQLNALALCTDLRMNTPHSKSLRQRVIVERDRVRTKIGGTVPHYID